MSVNMNMFKTLSPAVLATAVACACTSISWASPWVNQIGGRGADVAYALTETIDGRLCAAGTAWTGSRVGNEDGGVLLATDDAQQVFVACYQESGELDFVRPIAAGRGDAPRDIIAVADGDVVLTGLRESADGDADAFVSRFDSRGNELWTRIYGDSAADSGNALAVGRDGAIYLAAGFEGSLTWPDGKRLAKMASAGSRDAAVIRLESDGTIAWAQRFGGKGFDEATVVAARRDGGVLVGGTFRGTATVDGRQFKSRGFRDVIVVSLDADGATQWAVQLGGPSQDTIEGIAQDSRGHIVVAGNFHKKITLSTEHELHSAGSTDVFIARLDPTGNVAHATSVGGKLTDQVFDLTVDDYDRVVLAGHYQGTTDLAPGPQVVTMEAPSPGNSSGFVLVLDADSVYLGSQPIAGNGMEMVLGVQTLHDGNLGLTGLFNRDLGLTGAGAPLDARGKTDVFVARIARPGRASNARTNHQRHGEPHDLSLSW
jgi:hypothetical protein